MQTNELITLEQYGDAGWIHSDTVGPEQRVRARQGLNSAHKAMLSGRYDIVVLDEVNVAIALGLLNVGDVLALLEDRPSNVELVLTGRGAPTELVEQADLVTDMKAVKHYYEQGEKARKGIEY